MPRLSPTSPAESGSAGLAPPTTSTPQFRASPASACPQAHRTTLPPGTPPQADRAEWSVTPSNRPQVPEGTSLGGDANVSAAPILWPLAGIIRFDYASVAHLESCAAMAGPEQPTPQGRFAGPIMANCLSELLRNATPGKPLRDRIRDTETQSAKMMAVLTAAHSAPRRVIAPRRLFLASDAHRQPAAPNARRRHTEPDYPRRPRRTRASTSPTNAPLHRLGRGSHSDEDSI